MMVNCSLLKVPILMRVFYPLAFWLEPWFHELIEGESRIWTQPLYCYLHLQISLKKPGISLKKSATNLLGFKTRVIDRDEIFTRYHDIIHGTGISTYMNSCWIWILGKLVDIIYHNYMDPMRFIVQFHQSQWLASHGFCSSHRRSEIHRQKRLLRGGFWDPQHFRRRGASLKGP